MNKQDKDMLGIIAFISLIIFFGMGVTIFFEIVQKTTTILLAWGLIGFFGVLFPVYLVNKSKQAETNDSGKGEKNGRM